MQPIIKTSLIKLKDDSTITLPSRWLVSQRSSRAGNRDVNRIRNT